MFAQGFNIAFIWEESQYYIDDRYFHMAFVVDMDGRISRLKEPPFYCPPGEMRVAIREDSLSVSLKPFQHGVNTSGGQGNTGVVRTVI